MQGGATAVADHRAFWSRARALRRGALIAAYPARPRKGKRRVRASWDAWGPMTASPAGSPARVGHGWLWPLLAMFLVAEWMSRRTRGAA